MDHYHVHSHHAQDQSFENRFHNYHDAKTYISQYDPESRVVYQMDAVGLTSGHLEYHGYKPSSNFAGFIFDIGPGYGVSVNKLRLRSIQ